MDDLCEHETFRDICGICHRDKLITALRAENEKLRADLLTGVLMLSETGLDPREKCEMAYEYMSAALGGKDE